MAARLLRRWGKPEFVSLLVSGALTLAIGSCGHDEQTPVTGPVAPSPSPAPIAPLTVTRVDLIVPPSIAPGQSLQFQANARMSDGSVQDVTSLAQWSAAGRLIEIGSGGLAKGVSVGETFVTARYQSRSGSTTVLVLPAGTFRLKGKVVDEGQPLSGATVNIIGGTGEGLTTSTVSDGAYVLYGVGGHVRAQVKRDGYLNLLKDFDVTANQTTDFGMILDHPRERVDGSYTLTVDARCTGGSVNIPLPRTYTAAVTQDGPRLEVTLSGADFVVSGGHGNRFSGAVDGSGRATFTLGSGASYYYYYNYSGVYDVVERLTNANVLILNGMVTANATRSRISGTFAGYFSLMRGTTPPFVSAESRCYSQQHVFDMVRR